MARRTHRLTTVLVMVITAALCGVFAVPGLAVAHSRLISTNPTDGSIVRQQKSTVDFTFNEVVQRDYSTIVVRGPGGVSYSRGNLRVVDTTVTQPIYPLRSGKYTVDWRIVSADGHPVQGEFVFTVALPSDQEPTVGPPSKTHSADDDAAHESDNRSSSSWIVWGIVVVVAVVATAGFAVLGRRRHRR